MDPITLIAAALAAGAAASVKITTEEATKDGYKAFKGMIQRKLASNPAAKVVWEEHEKDPDTYAAPLKKLLGAAAVDQDAAILDAARALLEKIDAQPGSGPVITQSISNVKYAATSATGDASIGSINEQARPRDRDG
jgi:ABC-type glycerol-3-phosphate transport system substrate-binding protein